MKAHGALPKAERARRAELLASGFKGCTSCGLILPVDRFGRHAHATSGLRASCRDCSNRDQNPRRKRWRESHIEEARAIDRAYYAKNRDHEKAQVARSRAKNPAVVFYREWRDQPCPVCGVRDWRIIEGHHVNPAEKERRLGAIFDLSAMQDELAKCVPLCRNHHTIVHAELRNDFRGAALQDVIDYLRRK